MVTTHFSTLNDDGLLSPAPPHAMTFLITLPATSVRRNRRPL